MDSTDQHYDAYARRKILEQFVENKPNGNLALETTAARFEALVRGWDAFREEVAARATQLLGQCRQDTVDGAVSERELGNLARKLQSQFQLELKANSPRGRKGSGEPKRASFREIMGAKSAVLVPAELTKRIVRER